MSNKKVKELPIPKKEEEQAKEAESKDFIILTNGEIDALVSNQGENISALNALIGFRTLPIQASFALEDLSMNNLDGRFKVINNRKRKLIEKYGAKDEKGKLIEPNPGQFKIVNIPWFNKEFEQLMAIENKIEWKKVTLDKEKDLPEKGLSPRDIMILRKIVDFTDANQQPGREKAEEGNA